MDEAMYNRSAVVALPPCPDQFVQSGVHAPWVSLCSGERQTAATPLMPSGTCTCCLQGGDDEGDPEKEARLFLNWMQW